MARAARLGLAQLAAGPLDADGARDRTVAAAAELFGRGADLVVLPELAVPGYVLDDGLLARAEALDGPTVEAWRTLAGRHGGLVCGGFAERDGDAVFNTAVLVDGSGVLLHYRKLHPFAQEKALFTPGDRGLPVVDTPLGRVGVCVCYDLRFVETARVLALQGADLVCVPTAWTAGFDQVQWDADGLAPQAHGAVLQANLNQVFMACASQVGVFGETTFLGSSIVVDPYGARALGPLPATAPELAVVDVELGDAVAAQHRGPLISPRADRRADVYGLRYDGQVL